jgi:Xaa-Pro aminopeptidase
LDKVAALQQVLERDGISAAILTSMENIRYLTKYYVWTSYSPNAFAIVPARGEPVLCVPDADASLARAVARVRVESYQPGLRGVAAAAAACKQELALLDVAPSVLAIEDGSMTVDRFQALKSAVPESVFVDITSSIASLRLIKDDEEQRAFRRASDLVAAGVDEAVRVLRAGASEIEVKGLTDVAAYKLAARECPDAVVISQTNVLAGAKLDRLHDAAGGQRVGPGDTVFVRARVSCDGYWAAMARTLVVPGAPGNREVNRTMEAVVEAQRVAIEEVVAGRSIRDASREADRVLSERGLAGRRVLSIIQGLGLTYHEFQGAYDPDLKFNVGMSLCAQVYVRLPGMMLGQADCVLIGPTGPEVLTRLSAERSARRA